MRRLGRIGVIATALLLVWSVPSHSATQAGQTSLGLSGAMFISLEDNAPDPSWNVSGSLNKFVTDAIALGPAISMSGGDNFTNGLIYGQIELNITGSVVTVPFVSVGAGVSITESRTTEFDPFTLEFSEVIVTNSLFSATGTGGLKFFMRDNVSLVPKVVYTKTFDEVLGSDLLIPQIGIEVYF